MDISFQRPSHRLHHRLNAPLHVTIDGKKYKSLNWSLGGFSISLDPDSTFDVGDRIDCSLVLPFQGFEIIFECDAQIVRIDTTTAQVGAQFLNLEKRQHDILKFFTEELVRGSMTSIREAIIRIDTPVTPVSSDPDANPIGDMPLSRWTTKNISIALGYSVAGLLLLTYMAITFFYNYFVLEVNTAMVFSRMEKIVSSANGKINDIHFTLNEMANKDEVLFTMEDPSVREKVALAELKITKIEARLSSQKKRLDVEKQKLQDFANFAVLDMERAKKELASQKILVTLANKEVTRLKKLQKGNLASQTELDQALSKLTLAYNKQQQAEVDLQQREEVLDEVDKGYYFTGHNLIGSSNEYSVQTARLKEEVEIAREELQVLIDHEAMLKIRAPSKGRLTEFFFPEGSSIRQGDIIALFERDQKRKIHAYLTQREVLSLKVGTQCKIHFPSIDATMAGIVSHIDRTGGIGEESSSNFNWVEVDRSVLVKIDLTGVPSDQIREMLPHGLPAMVMFTGIQKGLIGKAVRTYLLRTEDE